MITVFTPTYNRANTIHRVWDSLCNQTFADFEWIIVDDGSTDNIEEVVQQYIAENKFPITFHKFKENKGKHFACNKGIELAKGEFFIIADSDDAFLPDALAFFIEAWNGIPEKEHKNFCGIRTCCQNQHGDRVSDQLDNEPLDATMAEAFYVHKFRKESWCMILTEWHRKYKFPEEKSGYFPEGIMWKAMSRNHKLRFYNKVTRIYYLEEGNSIMSGKKHPREKVNRNLLGASDILNNDITYFKKDPVYFFKNSILYSCYSFFDKSILQSFGKLNNIGAKLLYLAVLPIGFFAFIYKSIRH